MITPEFKLVKINDDLEYWSDSIADKVKSIYSVYAYNEHEVTHLCEITPSYELHFLYKGNDLKEEMYEEGMDDERENLIGKVHLASAYESMDNDGIIYMHCSDIEALPTENKKDIDWLDTWESFLEDADGEEDKAKASAFDVILESEQGNPTFC